MSPKRVNSTEGYINHYGAVRLRAKGSGNLKLRLLSLDEEFEDVLVPLVLKSSTNIEPTQLANFNQQRASLEVKTTEIDETFEISRIIIFTKPTASSFPQ